MKMVVEWKHMSTKDHQRKPFTKFSPIVCFRYLFFVVECQVGRVENQMIPFPYNKKNGILPRNRKLMCGIFSTESKA